MTKKEIKPKKNKKEESETEALARMVANGFNHIDDQFEIVNVRLNGIELAVEATNRRMDDIIVPTLDAHARRIKNLEIAAG